ncbi:MAG: penicillin acylase family protein [Gammaproteobacteria bacterium]
MAGLTIPGIPLIVTGSNGDVAWGYTNVNSDVLDLDTLGGRRSTRVAAIRIGTRFYLTSSKTPTFITNATTGINRSIT